MWIEADVCRGCSVPGSQGRPTWKLASKEVGQSIIVSVVGTLPWMVGVEN